MTSAGSAGGGLGWGAERPGGRWRRGSRGRARDGRVVASGRLGGHGGIVCHRAPMVMPQHPTVLGYVVDGTTICNYFDKLTFQNNFPTLELPNEPRAGKNFDSPFQRIPRKCKIYQQRQATHSNRPTNMYQSRKTMSDNENVSAQRVQLVRHTFSYFFSYYWISLAALLLLYHNLNASHGMQFQPPWLDSSSYIDYTSKQAAMTAAWVAIAGISVREQKASSIVSSCLSRKIPSFCIALLLTFQSSTLLVANYAWFTKKGDDFFIKLTSGTVGVGFSLAALISPYLFILLAQGNPDPKTLAKRQEYLSREQTYLQKLVNDAAEIEKDATGNKKQKLEPLALKLFRQSTYVTSVAVICCIVGHVIVSALHIRPARAILPFTFMAVLIGLTSIAFFMVFLLTAWTWKQIWVQKTVDFNGEKLRRIIFGWIWKASCFASHKDSGLQLSSITTKRRTGTTKRPRPRNQSSSQRLHRLGK